MSHLNLCRTGKIQRVNPYRFKFSNGSGEQPFTDNLLYEMVAGAIYGAVGATILTTFGFSALSIPAVAVLGAGGGMVIGLLQNCTSLITRGHWYRNPTTDKPQQNTIDIMLRVAIAFLGSVVFFSLAVSTACAIGAFATEATIEGVRAADQFISSRIATASQYIPASNQGEVRSRINTVVEENIHDQTPTAGLN